MFLLWIQLCSVPTCILLAHVLHVSILDTPPKKQNVDGIQHTSVSSSGNYLVATSQRGIISIWDLKLRKRIAKCEPPDPCANKRDAFRYSQGMAVAACFESGNEDRIVFSDGLGICVWSWKELKQPLVLIPLDRLPRLIVAEDIVSPKSTRMIYLLGIDGVLYQLDMDAKKCVQQKRVRDSRGSRGHGSLCSTIEGSKLLYNTDSAINVIDLKAKADHEVVTMKGKDFITSMAVSKEIPLIVTGCGSGKVWLWDTRTGEHKVFCEDSGGGHSVAISAGEDLLAIEADKGAIVVYSIKQKRILCSMKGLDTGYTRIGFLNNDKGIYASGESSEIQFLDLTLDKKE